MEPLNPNQRELKFLEPCCFNAKGAEVPAEEAEARLAEFALRPLRKPSRPLRLSTPSRLRNLRDVFMRFSKSESKILSSSSHDCWLTATGPPILPRHVPPASP